MPILRCLWDLTAYINRSKGSGKLLQRMPARWVGIRNSIILHGKGFDILPMGTTRKNSSGSITDQRKHPRIALTLPITIIGLNTVARMVDFSLGGFNIALDATEQFKQGQQIRIAIRFPDETAISYIKATIAHIGERGLGCRLIDVDPSTAKVLETNFEFFRSMLPIE